MDDPVVVEVVGVDELPLGERASRRLVVRWSDGTVGEALRWYADEWLVSEGDLVGKTSQASPRGHHHLGHRGITGIVEVKGTS